MENSEKMYLTLFNAVTTAMRILEEAQIKCEEIAMEGEEKGIPIVNLYKDEDGC